MDGCNTCNRRSHPLVSKASICSDPHEVRTRKPHITESVHVEDPHRKASQHQARYPHMQSDCSEICFGDVSQQH